MDTALLILGMHRSGTSALTGALKLLGVELGDRLMPGRPSENDLGYFENLEIFDFHQRVLSAAGSSWHDPLPPTEEWLRGVSARPFRQELAEILGRCFGGTPCWAVKDPRLCRLMPLWADVFRELDVTPRILLIYRHPEETAASLALRNGFSKEKSALLWIEHNLGAERYTRPFTRVLLSYQQFLARPGPTLGSIAEALDIEWPRKPDQIHEEIRGFLSPELRHHRAARDRVRGFGELSETLHQLHRLLNAAARHGRADSEAFDQIAEMCRRGSAETSG